MNEISFVELGSGAPAVTRRFFTELFGWVFTPMGGEENGWFRTETVRVGLHGNDPEWGMVPFFRVPDLEQAIARVRALGGEAEDMIADVPDFGRFCNCRDPQGMRFGLHQL